MPIFYMMVGIPGSGKSFYAEQISGAMIRSSDKIRAEILGDVSDQSQQDLVFQTLHKRIIDDLNAGRDTVYDATNISYKRRMIFLQQLKASCSLPIHKVCIFVATPYSKCLENNNGRERCIPESVIYRMYQKFDIPMMAEGWDEIRVLNSGDRHEETEELMKRLSKLEHDNPNHQFTVGQHSLAAFEYFLHKYDGYSNYPLGCAVLLHDIGKEFTKVFHDSRDNPTDIAHFYNHERVGAYESFAYTADLSQNTQLLVALLIRWHMYPYVVEKSNSPARTEKKLKSLLGEDIYNQIAILNDCDRHAH